MFGLDCINTSVSNNLMLNLNPLALASDPKFYKTDIFSLDFCVKFDTLSMVFEQNV